MIANGLACGMGEYFSSKAHKKYILAERRKEKYNYKNYRDEGMQVLIETFQDKGMSSDDARLIVQRMSNYENLFVHFMVTLGKGLQIPEDTEYELCTDSGTLFFSFSFLGSLPLLAVCLMSYFGMEENVSYAISLGLTAGMITILGFVKSSFW